VPGTTYRYVVTATDWIENESDDSPEASATAGDPGAGTEFVRADPDGSEEADISDAILTLGYLFLGDPPPKCLDAADVDDSGEIDLSDAIYSLSYLFVGGAEPKSPFLGCGLDETIDELDCKEYLPCN